MGKVHTIAIGLLVGSASASAQTGQLYANLTSTTVMPNEPVEIVLFAEWEVQGWLNLAGLDTTLHASGGAYTFVAHGGLDPVFTMVSGSGTPELHLFVGTLPIIAPTVPYPNPVVAAVLAWSCDTPGVYDLGSITSSMTVYVNPLGTTVSVVPTEFSAQITVVPAPAGLFSLAAIGLVAARRRRV